MKTRLSNEHERILAAIAVVRKRACPSIARLIEKVHFTSFTKCKNTRLKNGLDKTEFCLLSSENYGLFVPSSDTIILNVKRHKRQYELQQTIVHELTHFALKELTENTDDEEILCRLAEREYRARRKLHVTRSNKRRLLRW